MSLWFRAFGSHFLIFDATNLVLIIASQYKKLKTDWFWAPLNYLIPKYILDMQIFINTMILGAY